MIIPSIIVKLYAENTKLAIFPVSKRKPLVRFALKGFWFTSLVLVFENYSLVTRIFGA